MAVNNNPGARHDKHFNTEYETTLDGAITAGATSITVDAAPPGDYEVPFRIVITDGTTTEIARVTEFTGTSLTVERDVEVTDTLDGDGTGYAFADGDDLSHKLTAGAVAFASNTFPLFTINHGAYGSSSAMICPFNIALQGSALEIGTESLGFGNESKMFGFSPDRDLEIDALWTMYAPSVYEWSAKDHTICLYEGNWENAGGQPDSGTAPVREVTFTADTTTISNHEILGGTVSAYTLEAGKPYWLRLFYQNSAGYSQVNVATAVIGDPRFHFSTANASLTGIGWGQESGTSSLFYSNLGFHATRSETFPLDATKKQWQTMTNTSAGGYPFIGFSINATT